MAWGSHRPGANPGVIQVKGFGVGLKAMKTLKPEELADAITKCDMAGKATRFFRER